ncbi:lytic transglycosylase domain-containing protein [Nocardia sp. NBC_01329]|uniref:lytic transglycosylase domain-containing protein n=1 Tax=Nocardia sp. NBC_01329 TaxID=2903594 RepID=UPI002E16155F|nr:lytic murein transglycosylase [Nocardia sp. NBC_01329]
MSALVMAGLVASGSAAHTTLSSTPPEAPGARLAADTGRLDDTDATVDAPLPQTLGMLPVERSSPRKLRALSPSPADGIPPFGGIVPLQTINLPQGGGALGIPEIVLAAYRNAELALQSSTPGCGVTWNLLAGIGRIESGHASNGRTDTAGTTDPPILGPALDGSLPGNEVIRAADGGYVRALGPMQFLPSTWSRYAADGNADGHADPHNVFDAALGAGKYLCSGGLNLRDPQQELRAVLRYNNSMSYAANVLSWSAAYRTGGRPAPVTISPDSVPPGSRPTELPGGPTDLLAAQTDTRVPPPPPSLPVQIPRPEPMIRIPGLPPIPCGLLCPPAPGAPKVGEALPDPAPVVPDPPAGQAAPAPAPGEPAPAPAESAPAPAESAPAAPAPAENRNPPAPAPAPAPAAPPAITLPGGIVIPLPIAAAPASAAPTPAPETSAPAAPNEPAPPA